MSGSIRGYSSLELRNYLGLTQFAYAFMLGVSQGSVSQREHKGGQAGKWEYLAVKGALFTHNGLSGCLCSMCHRSRLNGVHSR